MNLRGLLWEYAICRFPRTGKLVDDSGESDPRLLKGTLLPSTALHSLPPLLPSVFLGAQGPCLPVVCNLLK